LEAARGAAGRRGGFCVDGSDSRGAATATGLSAFFEGDSAGGGAASLLSDERLLDALPRPALGVAGAPFAAGAAAVTAVAARAAFFTRAVAALGSAAARLLPRTVFACTFESEVSAAASGAIKVSC
jgi:hypothetical protein